jgi:hypothetical protein
MDGWIRYPKIIVGIGENFSWLTVCHTVSHVVYTDTDIDTDTDTDIDIDIYSLYSVEFFLIKAEKGKS